MLHKMDASKINFFVKPVVSVFLLLLSMVSVPCLLILWVLCYLYRSLIIVIAQMCRNDLRSMLRLTSTILSDDYFNENPSNCSIVTVLTVKGNLSLLQVANLFEKNVIRATLKHDSELRYPQLQQYPVSFMGYPFWKQDNDFSLINHVSEYNEETNMNLSLSQIHQNVMNGAFQKYKSPWQLTIFRNGSNTNQTFLALKMHHCMADGRSIIKLVVECLGKTSIVSKEAKFETRTIKEKLKYWMLLPFGLISVNADLIKYQIEIARQHPWKISMSSSNESLFYVKISNEIPLEIVKKTAEVTGVQTSTVILHCIATAIGKILRLRNQICKSLTIYMTLPKEGHPSTLTNHLYASIPDIPIVGTGSPQRILEYDTIYKYMQKSDHTRHLEFITEIIATLPGFLRAHLAAMRVVSAGLSNITGTQEGFSVGGYPCLEFTMSTGLLQGSTGIGFTVLSYKKRIQVSAVAKGKIFKENETVLITKLIEKQFLNYIPGNDMSH